ncbi:hypothetical protein FFLO_07199 [Filobasidium floriforme]|uniref:Uncharacterized protein n=1 Tax=Filobasidium floriforme TaxID=5210 RepID=A0A8K0JDF9_9TREE|nr:hypothetical protein FFLO_07199 [Filobasidium floriforme]
MMRLWSHKCVCRRGCVTVAANLCFWSQVVIAVAPLHGLQIRYCNAPLGSTFTPVQLTNHAAGKENLALLAAQPSARPSSQIRWLLLLNCKITLHAVAALKAYLPPPPPHPIPLSQSGADGEENVIPPYNVQPYNVGNRHVMISHQHMEAISTTK